MTQRKSPRDLRVGLAGVYANTPSTTNKSALNEAAPSKGFGEKASPSTKNTARIGGAPALFVAQQKQGLLEEVEQLRAENEVLREQGTVLLDANLIDDFWPSDRLVEAFADEAFLTLLESIRSHGQDQPVIVRPHPEKPGRYQIGCGRRRREACRQLAVPLKTMIRPLSDDALLQIMLRENEEREDLSLYERAVFIRAMQKQTGLSIRGLAKQLQLSAGYVSRLARLPQLDEQLKQMIGDPRPLSMRTLERLGELFDDESDLARERLERVVSGWGGIRPAAEPEARARQIIKLAEPAKPVNKPIVRELRNIENKILGHLVVDPKGNRRIDLSVQLDRNEVEQILQAIETLRLGKLGSV